MEKQDDFVQKAYLAALNAGLCHNRSQFAELVGIDRSSLYRKELSDKTIYFVEKILADHGVVIGGDNNGTAIGTQQPAPQPTELQQVMSELTAQREMYDRQFSELLRQNSQLINIITNSLGK